MKFSTQNLLSLRRWQSHADVYRDALAECRLADQLGFHTIRLARGQVLHSDIFSAGGETIRGGNVGM